MIYLAIVKYLLCTYSKAPQTGLADLCHRGPIISVLRPMFQRSILFCEAQMRFERGVINNLPALRERDTYSLLPQEVNTFWTQTMLFVLIIKTQTKRILLRKY